jgi:magnesium transporter
MPFLSQLIGRQVADLDGETIGTLKELLANYHSEIPHPLVVAIEVKQGNRSLLVSMSDVTVLIAPAVSLNKRQQDIVAYTPCPEDLSLVRDVLDKQIIDTNGVRVVRVNDLELMRVGTEVYVANVDISGSGLIRRMGFGQIGRRLVTRGRRGELPGIISWEDVELISSDQPMRLKVPGEKISELHPADLAEIISDLSRQEGREFLGALDIETLADTLEEVEPEFQASLVEDMPNERVADVLEEMEPDEAADLLAELPEDRSQELLELMEDDEAEDVRKLLAYPEDSAGGIMTTEYMSVPPHLTAEQVMQALREKESEAETIFYMYVTDPEEHLIGVFSLRQLVLAQPNARVFEFMERRVVSIHLEDSQEDCAQAIAKYDLIAIPVVDDEKRIHGIVTADDALDKIIPTAWKKRLPHLYH